MSVANLVAAPTPGASGILVLHWHLCCPALAKMCTDLSAKGSLWLQTRLHKIRELLLDHGVL